MRYYLSRMTALAVCVLLAVSVLAIPSASAQDFTAPGEYPADDFEFEDPIVCGGDFFGRIIGGGAPYTLTYNITGAGGTFDLGSYMVAAEGLFTSPPGFTAGVPFGIYTVTVEARDTFNQSIEKTFVGEISAVCDPAEISDPILCGGDFFGSIIGAAPFELTYTMVGDAGTFALGSFTVAAEGAFRSPPGFTGGVPDGLYDVTIEAIDGTGAPFGTMFPGTKTAVCGGGAVGGGGVDPVLQAIQDRLREEAEARAAAAAGQEPVAVPLAATGSTVSVPGAIGFTLIGAGGLVLLAARRRETNPDS